MKPVLMNDAWYKHLKDEVSKLSTLQQKLSKVNFSPKDPKNIFRAFSILEPKDVRICLLGLSPYMDDNATGNAFAIPKDKLYKEYPFSLKVISDAIAQEYDIYEIDKWFDPSLGIWESQGILLLNSALTCEVNKPEAHLNDWKPLITKVLKTLNEIDNGLIFYTFGSTAKEYMKLIDKNRHYHFHSVHPAALYYNSNMVFDSHFKEIAELYYKNTGNKLHWLFPF